MRALAHRRNAMLFTTCFEPDGLRDPKLQFLHMDGLLDEETTMWNLGTPEFIYEFMKHTNSYMNKSYEFIGYMDSYMNSYIYE